MHHAAQARFHVAPTPEAVHAARHRITQTVRTWNVPLDEDLHSRLELVASELLTNAALHVRSRLTAVITLEEDLLVIEVSDPSPAPPQPRTAGPYDESGRGLTLVDALCLTHGSELTASGKRCWAILAPRSPTPALEAASPDDSAAADDLSDTVRWSITPAGTRLLAQILPTRR
ncbi:anti-sigma regulatory factor (Ser/Thr protein kinase) [Streptomyces sp. SAI-170]|uniref:ATP-binding protein n=1 Tax=Streptomyces sp. SAI-170 TaxID=3377729 RepID=UPI003C7C9006